LRKSTRQYINIALLDTQTNTKDLIINALVPYMNNED